MIAFRNIWVRTNEVFVVIMEMKQKGSFISVVLCVIIFPKRTVVSPSNRKFVVFTSNILQYIAHNTTKDDDHSGISQPCNKCSLCGKHGNNPNMVISTGFITSENNKKLFLTQRLTCDNYGIYAAQCKLCHQIYVGQTKNKFSVRWTNHRTF